MLTTNKLRIRVVNNVLQVFSPVLGRFVNATLDEVQMLLENQLCEVTA